MDGRIGARWGPAILGGKSGGGAEERAERRSTAQSHDGRHERLESAMGVYGSSSVADRPTSAGDLGQCIFWLLWQCIRVPLFLLLVTLEPVVSFVLGAAALLGVLTAFFWKLVGPAHFPFVTLLSVSLGFALARILYQKCLQLLSL
jgi:hypothetical protein